MNTAKIVYRPVGLLVGALAGLAAGSLFSQAWKVVGHEDDAPDAMDEHRSWREILVAAALQGAIFAVVKAAADRAGATAVRRMSGEWPG